MTTSQSAVLASRYSGQRLGSMINDILDSSKLQNKKMKLDLNVGSVKEEVPLKLTFRTMSLY